jgi:hypothetical protein
VDGKKPNYMFPRLQGLPDEFRRLAAEATRTIYPEGSVVAACESGRAAGLRQAAQMLEERLNGSA